MRRSLSVDLQEVKKAVGREIVPHGGTACVFSRQLADAGAPSVRVMLDSRRAHKFRLDPVILWFLRGTAHLPSGSGRARA
jgi:hypothetical protein